MELFYTSFLKLNNLFTWSVSNRTGIKPMSVSKFLRFITANSMMLEANLVRNHRFLFERELCLPFLGQLLSMCFQIGAFIWAAFQRMWPFNRAHWLQQQCQTAQLLKHVLLWCRNLQGWAGKNTGLSSLTRWLVQLLWGNYQWGEKKIRIS